MLQDSNEYIFQGAMNCLSSLGAQGTYCLVHLDPVALLTPLASWITADLLKDFRGREIDGGLMGTFAGLGLNACPASEHKVHIVLFTWTLLPYWRRFPAELQQEIHAGISVVVKLLDHSNKFVRPACD
jgi:hypothetical protein